MNFFKVTELAAFQNLMPSSFSAPQRNRSKMSFWDQQALQDWEYLSCICRPQSLTRKQGLRRGLLAVLPKGTPLIPVGGIGADNLAVWRTAGAAGFGLGSSLYRPGDDAATVRVKAAAIVSAFIGDANAGRR